MSARFAFLRNTLLNSQPGRFSALTFGPALIPVFTIFVVRVWESRVIPLAADVVWARAKQMLWLNLTPAVVAGPANTISIGDTRTAGS